MTYFYGSTYDRQSRRAVLENGQQSSLVLYLDPRQFATVVSDTSINHWTTQSGGTSNLFSALDETIPDNTDYIRSYFSSVTDSVTLALGAVQTPLSGPRYLRYRYGKDAAGGHRVDLTVELLESGTPVQTWVHQNIAAGFVEVAQAITNSITNYGALSTRFTYQQV